MKCEICKKTVGQTFLQKALGTIIKDAKGKQHSICSACQKQFKTKEHILQQLPL